LSYDRRRWPDGGSNCQEIKKTSGTGGLAPDQEGVTGGGASTREHVESNIKKAGIRLKKKNTKRKERL